MNSEFRCSSLEGEFLPPPALPYPEILDETALVKGTQFERCLLFFLFQIRSAGTEANVEEILKFSKLFEDGLADRRQLLCRANLWLFLHGLLPC